MLLSDLEILTWPEMASVLEAAGVPAATQRAVLLQWASTILENLQVKVRAAAILSLPTSVPFIS